MDNTKPLIDKTETVIKIADDKTEQETDALDDKIKVLSPKSIAERKTDTALNAANSFR